LITALSTGVRRKVRIAVAITSDQTAAGSTDNRNTAELTSASTSAGRDNLPIGKRIATLPDVGGSAAPSTTCKIVICTVSTPVKAPRKPRGLTANEYGQRLSGCHRQITFCVAAVICV
jgi:hypothetical protein